MEINFQRLIGEFEKQWVDKPIEYKDKSGEWKKENDLLFGSISAAIQLRGQISVDELQRISQWKVQGKRNDANVKKNSEHEVERRSRAALEASDDVEAIEELIELSGVGVPMASTVLTVADPSHYAIIDYRALRGLAAAKPHLIEPDEYATLAEFLGHFRTYLDNPDTYAFYMQHVRELADDEGLTPREIDMALWAFDKAEA